MDQIVSSLRRGLAPAPPSWRLTVRDARAVTPLIRRLRFDASGPEPMEWTPGQDFVLNLPAAPQRHYTIRALRGGSLDIDFVLHGHGPAAAWAKSAQPGEEIEAVGPRGRTRLTQDADWSLFVGDETCIPAIFAMVETLPPGARAWAFIVILSPTERQAVSTAADFELEWIVRGGPARPNTLLLDRLKTFEAPGGEGHAYLIGETSGVRAQRHFLIEQGWRREQITAEGYWRPGRIGGHDHV